MDKQRAHEVTMRPTTVELLKAFQYNLDNEIAPDLSSPWPKRMARVMSALMQYLITLEEQGISRLQEDNAALRSLLEDIQRHAVASPGQDHLIQPIRQTLAESPSRAAHVCRESLINENLRLQLATETALPLLEAPQNASLLERARAVLCEQMTSEINTFALPLLQAL